MRVTCIAGGVGGARMALALQEALAPGELTVVGNVGDDTEHWGLQIAPDKDPDVRLDALGRMGALRIPTTSGILIGIGETRAERVEALLALRDLHAAHGHLQEVIVQNFRAKPDTKMRDAPEPSLDDHLWTIAIARLILPDQVALQAPPNLAHADFPRLLEAGIDDWGGVSPVTPDHVNPEAPWPEIERLEAATVARGLTLLPRLTVYPRYLDPAWVEPAPLAAALRLADGQGRARPAEAWRTGSSPEPPAGWRDGAPRRAGGLSPAFARALSRAADGAALDVDDAEALVAATGPELAPLAALADERRRERSGDAVTYVVWGDVGGAAVCYFQGGFCAVSQGRLAVSLRGAA
ncbi:MAG: 7,8-didemethyl-8-hydroxy-5-deazariboflavin synthase CofG, partial [Actinomycetota bacterium]